MKIFRKTLFWLHLVAGVLGGIVIFIMCVTGAALSFEKNILERVEYGQRFVTVGEKRLSEQELLAKVLEQKPNAKPSSMAVSNNPAASVTFALGREGLVFVDPNTGAITGEGNKSLRAFFGTMTDLHRWIALSGDGRPIGKAITGACNLMFLFLAISGVYIWFPRKFTWKHFRPVLWFRSTESGKARDFNWHNTIGFWSSLVLVILTITAAIISYQWAGNLLYTLTGNEVPTPQAPAPPKNAPSAEQAFVIPENINSLWSRAAAQSEGWKSISMRLPAAKDAVFTIDEGKSLNIFARSTLTLDAASGEITKWDPYEKRNAAQQLRSWSRFTHTGESFGIIGQIIGFIACIGGAFLVYTGFALTFRRLTGWVRKRSNETSLP
ncbi:MAG TPA: PepSY-associated TM helix domain-containing protein [Pyrinomonadaceae bacterium]|nr:PepSY-associated TM helix domain-containing protein [Pyrinomonadaceae bacterium]